MYEKITVIGTGLIGGSLGLAIKKNKIARKVIGYGRNYNKLKLAKIAGAVDLITTDLKEAVKDSDIIILCLPIRLILKFSKKISGLVKKGCIITDAGSTKSEIVKSSTKIFKNAYFVGSHPLAGSHNSGIKFAKQDLFEDSTSVITPIKNTDKTAVKKIKFIWERIGAKVILMTPEEHDRLVSLTSHLPHLVAVSLTNTVLDKNIKKIKQMIASGFKDTTRISASSSILWSDICFTNKTNIIKGIEKFKNQLTEIERALKNNNFKKLKSLLKKAKLKREKI